MGIFLGCCRARLSAQRACKTTRKGTRPLLRKEPHPTPRTNIPPQNLEMNPKKTPSKNDGVYRFRERALLNDEFAADKCDQRGCTHQQNQRSGFGYNINRAFTIAPWLTHSALFRGSHHTPPAWQDGLLYPIMPVVCNPTRKSPLFRAARISKPES